jgi:hypothetical protein
VVRMVDLVFNDLAENFPKAMLIDAEQKTVWIMDSGELRMYSEPFYNKVARAIRNIEQDF